MSNVDEEEELEEYKVIANDLKDQGNQAFQAGDVQLAISLFTQAIDLDPDNHVFYSNRAAAYMKADSKSKALHDAEKCVELAPTWSKGYSRLGAAQQCLKRFDAAIDNFKKGIELEPNNKSLWASLKACQDAFEADKKVRFDIARKERAVEEERLRLRETIKKDMEVEKKRKLEEQQQESLLSDFLSDINKSSNSEVKEKHVNNPDNQEEDNLLADFFSEVAATTAEPKPVRQVVVEPVEAPQPEENVRDESSLTEKYVSQDLGDGRAQCERLLATHFEWRNLNPYAVLQLGADATEEDIKLRYKKMSLKVHPDRLRDVENARDAFEQVKEAYMKLTDEVLKKNLLMHIENATDEYKKERRKLLAKGKKEEVLGEFEDGLNRHIMKHFAEIERMRRRSETNLRGYSARDKMAEAAELEKQAKHQEFDKSWTEDTRRDKRIGNWREFQTDPTAKKVKASSYKEESREEVKHGVVKTETWKKNW
eukprot:CAMPEP_0184985698 /NCGR_PEP_ID=MMETSP1098-20130426/14250_1 /TAXON_ID=89044 /ORGANISM="Spumella elongata, Strain CCAP 955/1" /LENGTH=481 /DNA_ID=CAMNT_0027509795 /DNA_START=37 /DNA_END=1479 /DNA_ORIENTATION=+